MFQGNENNIVTGSFDKTAKIFDVRSQEKLQCTFQHDYEIQDLTLYEFDTKMITVGGKKVQNFTKI